MKGPTPKRPEIRQRRNRTATSATLPSEEESSRRSVPPLPARELLSEVWHPKTVAWWASAWRSPMAAEWLASDVSGGLLLVAELYQKLWSAKTPSEFVGIASELRLQEVRFGLSPIDRRRLQWEIDKGEEAVDKTKARRTKRRLDRAATKDPRDVLKVVPA